MNTAEKKRVYFIRHGQSAGNVARIFQDMHDPLTEVGIQQAHIVAKKAHLFNAEIILTSPLIRALQTAKTIANEIKLPFETNELLREYFAPSKLWNTPINSPESKKFHQEMMLHLNDPEWHYHDEDNYHDLFSRANKLLCHLAERPEKIIIAVTHGAFMRVLLAAMITEGNPEPITAFRLLRFLSQKNTGITSCEYYTTSEGNSWRLVAWNDYSHLGELHCI